MLSILTEFLFSRSHHVMMESCRSKLVNVVSGVLQGSVLAPLLLLVDNSEILSILENKFIGYADDSTLMNVVPSQGVRFKVALSLNCENEWYDLRGMKMNASKTKTSQKLCIVRKSLRVFH